MVCEYMNMFRLYLSCLATPLVILIFNNQHQKALKINCCSFNTDIGFITVVLFKCTLNTHNSEYNTLKTICI
jgi:hypothetical protein